MNNIDNSSYKKIFENIKLEILKSQYKAMQSVNKELIFMYWHIGKIILDNSKWGNKFITNLEFDLKNEFPGISGFSSRNLKYMAKLAREYPDFEFVQQVVAQIPWTHNIIILDKESDFEKRKWYINETLKNGWSKSILKTQLETKLYDRQILADKSTNFSNTLPAPQSDLAMQTIKDPYIFDFISLKGKVMEKDIENIMVEKVKGLLLELGKGFAYVGNQYKLIIDEKEYFLDLLFYHLDLKCYIVVELKAREFLPEDAGKLNFYLSAVDKLLKKDTDNNSIGLILCREKKKFTVECALKDINKPIGVSEYKILEQIPDFLNSKLPEIEEIELHIP